MDFALASFGVALASLVLALVSLAISVRGASGNVRQLSLDVAELYDKVDHWQRRDRVRKLREGQERAAVQRADEQPSMMSKAELRELAFGGIPYGGTE